MTKTLTQIIPFVVLMLSTAATADVRLSSQTCFPVSEDAPVSRVTLYGQPPSLGHGAPEIVIDDVGRSDSWIEIGFREEGKAGLTSYANASIMEIIGSGRYSVKYIFDLHDESDRFLGVSVELDPASARGNGMAGTISFSDTEKSFDLTCTPNTDSGPKTGPGASGHNGTH